MKLFSKYHKGELQVQELVGEKRQAEFNGQAIDTFIIDGAIQFITEQEYAVINVEGENKQIWASVITGERGFMNARTSKHISINLQLTDINENDVFWKNIQKNKKVGMLIIELASRRRLRVNGVISTINDDIIEISVKESYPNCMKYIQRRHIVNRQLWDDENINEIRTGFVLDEPQQEAIRKSDTFFIGSANPKGYLDASHRGGNPGFVQLIDNKTIRIPDYKGNSMFNTFGNLILNENAGVVFWDFENGIILQMTGKASIHWDNPGTEKVTTGTKRFWEFTLDQWIEQKTGREFTWEFLDYSPHNPSTED